MSVKGFGRHKNGKAHPVHGKKGVDEKSFSVTEKGMNDKIEVKIDPVKKSVEEKPKSEKYTMFWQSGKPYKVVINEHPPYVAIDEMFQTGDNKWHEGKNIIFTQNEYEIKQLEKDAGGLYVDKILSYLDSAGALPITDKYSKDRHLYDLGWNTYTSYENTYDSLNNIDKTKLLDEVGIPKENNEPYTHSDSLFYADKKYHSLPQLTRKRLNQKLRIIMDNNLHNQGYVM